MNSQQGLQISDLSGVVRRRGKLMAIVAGGVILVMYWVAMALPNQYTSYATILVEPQSVDDQLVRAGVRESDLKERLGIMTAQILSRQRLSRMIDKYDLYPEESRQMQRQEVIDLMRSRVSVEPVLSELEADQRNVRDVEFNTFKIHYRSRNAETAAVVAQSIANDFLEANIQARVEVSQQSLDFMEDSIESLTQQLVQMEARIKDVKAENAGQLPEDLATNQRILQTVAGQLREARRSLDVAESDEAFWKNQVIAAVSLSAPNDTTSPQYRLKQLETELGMMRSKGFTDKHPDVSSTTHEIAMLKSRLEESPDGSGGSDSYAEQNAKSEQRRAELRAGAARQEIERLGEQLVTVQDRIAATPAVQERLDALERRYDHLRQSYLDFSQRRQQADVQANLERKQLGEQFRILESAFPAPRPSSPNRLLILVVGMLLGVGLGTAAGLIAENADTSLHQTRDLQQLASLPVLAAIPSIILEPDRVKRTRRAIRQGIAAAAVTIFFLVGGAVTYVIVNGMPGSGGAGGSGGGVEEEAGNATRDEQARQADRGGRWG